MQKKKGKIKGKGRADKKFVQKYQDYFPRGNNEVDEDYVFNFAPVKKLSKKE